MTALEIGDIIVNSVLLICFTILVTNGYWGYGAGWLLVLFVLLN